MKPFSTHKVRQNGTNVSNIHGTKATYHNKDKNIHLKNKSLLHFLQLLYKPDNSVSLHIFNKLAPNTLSPGSKTKGRASSLARLTISPVLL